MNVVWYAEELFACGWLRGILPASVLNAAGRVRVDVKCDALWCDLPGCDVAVFQRSWGAGLMARQAVAASAGVATVYDLDDALFDVPTAHPRAHELYARGDVRGAIETMLKRADLVTVSTPELAEYVRKRLGDEAPELVVVPNGVHTELWDSECWARQVAKAGGSGERVTIGWHASHAHKADAPLVGAALAEIMGEFPGVRLRVIGPLGLQDFGAELAAVPGVAERFESEAWAGPAELPARLAGVDIGLAPLGESVFNRCKSAVKWMEYGALAVPCVASDRRPYRGVVRNGETGFLAGDEPGEWRAALRLLVRHEEMRRRMGAAARLEVGARHSVRHAAVQWEAALRRARARADGRTGKGT